MIPFKRYASVCFYGTNFHNYYEIEFAINVTQRGEAMQQPEKKNWYVLYTKPRWERKIAARMENAGIECYCPLNRAERRWSDRLKIVFEPLFRCYLFVKIDPSELYKPLTFNGVLNYIHYMKSPAVVRNEEIEDIRRFMSAYKSVTLQKINVDVEDAIKVLYGPLMEKTGKVKQVHDNFVKIEIESLGYSLIATVSKAGIRKLHEVQDADLMV